MDRLVGITGQHFFVEHAFGVKLLAQLIVLDLGIGKPLIPAKQFFPGGCQFLVCANGGHQGTHGIASGHDQIAADEVENDRSQLCEEVVQKLDEELPDIDPQPDEVDLTECCADPRGFIFRCIVSMQIIDATDTLSQLVRELSHGPNPFPCEVIHHLLHFRNDVHLDRNGRNSDEPHHRVFVHDVGKCGDQNAALIDWQRNGIAKEPANRLGFGCHH